MNHRLKLSEVTRFADELHNETMKILDGIDEVRSNINQIIQMDTFQGETADNSKAYFSEVHGAILQAFEDLFTSLQHTIDNHIESFQENVDSNDSAIIESYYLEEQITKIEDDYNKLSQISQDINRIIQSVSDISSATAPSLTDVTNHLDDVIEVPVKLKKKLSNFTNSGKNDIANINTKISEVESLIGKIEAKRGTSKNSEWFETGLEWVHTNGFLLQRRAKTVGQAGTLSSGNNLTNNFTEEDEQFIADYLKALEKGEVLSNIDRYKGMDDYVYEGHVGKHNIFGQPVGGNAPQNGETISTILDFMPIIGNVKSIGEAYYGHDPLARRDLEDWERWVAAAGVIGGGIGKLGAKAVPKVADNLGDIVKGTGNVKQGDYSSLTPGGGLTAHELKGGHLIERHVGKTDEQLLERLKSNSKITGSSTFLDRSTAEKVANTVLNNPKNIEKTQKWLSDPNSRPSLPLRYKGNGEIIGRSVSRNSDKVENVTNAKIVLKKDNNGSFILTGYPVR